MTIIVLTDCPPRLRGDLTKWMQEINSGVYVGNLNARIRDALWERVCSSIKSGRATMVYRANNEQRMKFRIHNTTWEPVDFDGLTLIRRPLPRQRSDEVDRPGFLQPGFSNAAKQHKARQMAKRRLSAAERYVVIDVETTGLHPQKDQIIEMAALRVTDGQVEAEFQQLIRIEGRLPETIIRLTGLTDEELQTQGQLLSEALPRFLAFVGKEQLVSHNAAFDQQFLLSACRSQGLPLFHNRMQDTLALARRKVSNLPNYRLETLAAHFSIPITQPHRALPDCYLTHALMSKLNEI